MSFGNWKGNNYTINNTKQAGYGVAILVKYYLKYVHRMDLLDPKTETIWAEIGIPGNHRLLILYKMLFRSLYMNKLQNRLGFLRNGVSPFGDSIGSLRNGD